MEIEEYTKKLKKIVADCEESKRSLYVEFGTSNAKFVKGDIIKDHRWIILVDKITVYMSFRNYPDPVYHGIELKKDLTPKKSGIRQLIHGNNGVELVKKGV